MSRDAAEYIAQVGEGIDAQPLRGGDKTVQHGGGSTAFAAAIERPVAATDGDATQAALGTSWTTDIHGPLNWNPWLLIPSLISAWIISSVWSGDPGVRSLMRTLVSPSNWQWPTLAFLAFPVFLLASAVVAQHAHLPLAEPARGMLVLVLVILCAVRFIHNLTFTALYEEPGWRGFLLPTLQERFSPLVASIFIWLPWGLWHAPLDFSGGIGSNFALWVKVRLIYFIPITILLTWLYNRSGGLLSPALFHAAMNVFPFLLPYSPPMLSLIFLWAGYVVVSNRMWRHRDSTLRELIAAPGGSQ